MLADLEHAATIALERRAAVAAATPVVTVDTAAVISRTWSIDDPAIDPITGVFAYDAFIDRFDAFEGDPIGFLSISTEGFGRIGESIARLGLPTVLVQEGGYNVEALGANLTSFLKGFEGAR